MPDSQFFMDPDRLVEEFHALVRSVAAKYRSDHLSLDDLVQEGMIGLLEANRRFDPSRGSRFSTYAHFWICKMILGALGQESLSPLDPSTLEDIPDPSSPPAVEPDFAAKLPSDMPLPERQVIILSYEKSCTIAQISEQMGISRERVKQLRAKALRRLKGKLGG